MPFLRFSRDKRGYETTALVQPYRGRQGRARQKVLYWFRTPPNVKVGRPALDQDAIRWIEDHNPDIEFDWPKILEAKPTPAPVSDDQKGRRQRRGRTERPERDGPERRSTPRAAEPPRPPVAEATPPTPLAEVELVIAEPEPEQEALEQITHPDAEEASPPPLSAVASVLGREQLIRFRARYAELQARIIERGGDASRVEELRAQAELLNPDSWVTVEEARKGLETFEPKIRELRAALGLKRRRRSRRGGRRRHGSPSTSESSGAQADSADSSSNSADAPDGTDETDDKGEG